MAVIEFGPLPRILLIGVMLSTSLLDLSTLFGGGKGGIGLKKGSSYMHIIVWKMGSKISASCEENNNQNRPSVPTNFFNDCLSQVKIIVWNSKISCNFSSTTTIMMIFLPCYAGIRQLFTNKDNDCVMII